MWLPLEAQLVLVSTAITRIAFEMNLALLFAGWWTPADSGPTPDSEPGQHAGSSMMSIFVDALNTELKLRITIEEPGDADQSPYEGTETAAELKAYFSLTSDNVEKNVSGARAAVAATFGESVLFYAPDRTVAAEAAGKRQEDSMFRDEMFARPRYAAASPISHSPTPDKFAIS